MLNYSEFKAKLLISESLRTLPLNWPTVPPPPSRYEHAHRFNVFSFKAFLRLLLNVTEVTTVHQKWPKISSNSLKRVKTFG